MDINNHVEPRIRNKPCEDWADVGSNFSIVIDGASSLEEEFVPENFDSNGQWFSYILGRKLRSRVGEDKTMQQILFEILSDMEEDYKDMVGKTNLKKIEKPCASICWVRWDSKNNIEYFILSDSTLVLETGTKGDIHVTDPGPSPLDEQVSRKWQDKFEGGSRPEGMREHVKRNRSLMNDPDGYNGITIEPECVFSGIHSEMPLSDINSILLFTDGLKPAVSEYNIFNSWAEVRREIREEGLNSVVERVRDFEHKDSDCSQVPRLKQSDDIGISFVDFTD